MRLAIGFVRSCASCESLFALARSIVVKNDAATARSAREIEEALPSVCRYKTPNIPSLWQTTAGHVHDARAAGQLLQGVACGALLADKGYDADSLIEQLRDARIAAVIPPRSNRKQKRECDFTLYKERNLIERLFEKLKKFRAIATRHDKLARNFLGAIRLVAVVIQLN